MIDHTGIGVADVARSAVFYDAALGAALGLRRVIRRAAHFTSRSVPSFRAAKQTVTPARG
jgi:catechol 2,3-dioxygenase-like lactoylglutathione lyase family enzyme